MRARENITKYTVRPPSVVSPILTTNPRSRRCFHRLVHRVLHLLRVPYGQVHHRRRRHRTRHRHHPGPRHWHDLLRPPYLHLGPHHPRLQRPLRPVRNRNGCRRDALDPRNHSRDRRLRSDCRQRRRNRRDGRPRREGQGDHRYARRPRQHHRCNGERIRYRFCCPYLNRPPHRLHR